MKKVFISLFSCFFFYTTLYSFTEDTVVYKKVDDVELKLVIIYPDDIKENQLKPAMLFYYGGGWLSGDINHLRPQAEHFSRRGLVTVLAEYRVAGKHKTSPFVALSDAKSAMRFLVNNAKRYKIDRNKIIASGGSAGGHLAAALASVKGFNDEQDDTRISTIPAALVLFNPVLDNGPNGYGYDRIKDRYKEFSPLYNVKRRLPPTIIFLGTKDEIIPVQTMEKYKSEMLKKGNCCELYLFEGQSHGFFNINKIKNNPYYYETLNKADEFLVKEGFIKQE